MGIYTFVLDLDGGTYLAQVLAETLAEAIDGYLLRMRNGDDPSSDPRISSWLAESWEADSPTAVSNLKAVWCLSASDGEHQAILHIVGPT
jgi:hypothetical protein